MRLTGILLVLASALAWGCKKNPGQGGTASIHGKIWVRQYDEVFSNLNFSFWGKDENVYIIYGDQLGYSDKVATDYEGNFSFPYLRQGSYTVYVYSADSNTIMGPPLNPTAPDSAVVMQFEITKSSQQVDAGTITILKNK